MFMSVIKKNPDYKTENIIVIITCFVGYVSDSAVQVEIRTLEAFGSNVDYMSDR